jgi:tRNA (guanine-N7-)-methyltransferase
MSVEHPRVIADAPPPDTAEARSLLQNPKARTHIRSFALRMIRMTSAQEIAYANQMPNYGISYRGEVTDFSQYFPAGKGAPLIFEIGCGMGETTAHIAAALPNTCFVGIEVFTAGVGSLLKHINERELKNLRVMQHDAVEVLRDMVAPESLDGIHVFFPDPWHKVRHNKRRLIQSPFVALLAQRLKPGGILHCATDWEPYAQQMLEVLSAERKLKNTAEGYSVKPSYRPLTKFENRGIKLGHGVWDLVFEKI